MSDGGAESELDWLSQVLWDNARPAPGCGRYAVLPSRRHPRMLVPLGSGAAAAAVLERYASSRARSRLGARVLAAGFRVGVSPYLVRGRAGPSRSDPNPDLIERHLERLLGRPVQMSVFFQTGRPQKKPVLQLIAADGTVLAYAKVGWNDVTRRLVRAEGAALTTVARSLRADAPFAVPHVRHRGSWRGRELLVMDAVPVIATDLLEPLPTQATCSLMSVGSRSSGLLTESAYWHSQLARSRRWEAPAVQSLVDALRSQPSAGRIDLGASHGDWVPWNIGRAHDGRLLVWDWEWFRDDAPTGLDALQWLFQVELNLRRRHPAEAVDRTLGQAAQALPALGVPVEAAPMLLALHLIESMLRLHEARGGGVGGVIPVDRYEVATSRLLAVAA